MLVESISSSLLNLAVKLSCFAKAALIPLALSDIIALWASRIEMNCTKPYPLHDFLLGCIITLALLVAPKGSTAACSCSAVVEVDNPCMNTFVVLNASRD